MLLKQDLTASPGMALHLADVLLEELQHAAEPRAVPASACRELLQVVVQAMLRATPVLCQRLRYRLS